MTVATADLEASLARVRAAVADPRAGVFGPGSRVWAVNREGVVFLGGGRAVLLQLAHPFVAQAVADHSTTRDDVLGRFVRTFDRVFAMVFGDLDAALSAARSVHALHERIRGRLATVVGPYPAGTPYEANDPDALLWVHATLWDTSVLLYELAMGPLPPAVRAAYWEETKRFAALFGIPDAVLPPTWDAFRRYVDETVASRLAVGPLAREMATFLLDPARSRFRSPWRWGAVMTAGLLPPTVREAYGLPFGPARRRVFGASVRALRATWRRVPGPLRWQPPYLDAVRRLAGRPGPHPMVRVMDRVVRVALR